MPLKPHHFRADDEDHDGNEWLTTFADMSMLLLTFFILLFALSSLDVQRFGDFSDAMRQSLGTEGAGRSGGPPPAVSDSEALLDAVRLQQELIARQRQTFMAMRTYLNQKNLDGKVSALFDDGVITLRLPGDVLFESGQVELKPEAKEILAEIKDLLIKQNDQTINIKGYTDDLPPAPGGRFRDNWEISSLRAVNVLRYMLGAGIEANRMTSTGLADMNPLFPNITEENRAMNRRVEFVLEQRVGQ